MTEEREFKYCGLCNNTREKLLRQIDIGEWKHSRHLPRDPYGYVDWNDARTIRKILDVLEKQRLEAIRQLNTAKECQELISKKCYPKNDASESFIQDYDRGDGIFLDAETGHD